MIAPPSGGGADRRIVQEKGSPELARSAPPPQEPPRCAGSCVPGHPPTIVWGKAKASPGAELVAVFDWHADGRPALLCASCWRQLKKHRGRACYSKARAADGRLRP
jgi:hypothetical protein